MVLVSENRLKKSIRSQ